MAVELSDPDTHEPAAQRRLHRAVALTGVFVIALAALAPRGFESGWLLARRDDPAAIANHEVDRFISPQVVDKEIRAALAADDVDLANSFTELADDKKIKIDPALTAQVNAANETMATAGRTAQSFTRGLITGEPDNAAALAGTALGDLFVIGDIRDAAREGAHLVNGEPVDQLILGLSCVGIAITAGTFVTFGVGLPARIGVSMVKAARKTGRIGGRLATFIGRSLRDVVDTTALGRALANASITEPAVAVRAVRESVKVEKAGGLMRVLENVGTVQAKAGTQAALDGLRLAESPAEVSRLAKLAEKAGGKTRAILKVAGRAAIAFGFALFDLASWLFFVLMLLWGVCSGVKRTTEHTTLWYVRWRKRRRAARNRRLALLRPVV